MLHGQVLLAQGILSCVFLIAAALLAERMVPFAGIFTTVMDLFYYYIGMETSLFVFLLIATVYAYANDKIGWLPLLCTLTLLTRFEGGVLIPVVAWLLWKQHRIPAVSTFCLPLY